MNPNQNPFQTPPQNPNEPTLTERTLEADFKAFWMFVKFLESRELDDEAKELRRLVYHRIGVIVERLTLEYCERGVNRRLSKTGPTITFDLLQKEGVSMSDNIKKHLKETYLNSINDLIEDSIHSQLLVLGSDIHLAVSSVEFLKKAVEAILLESNFLDSEIDSFWGLVPILDGTAKQLLEISQKTDLIQSLVYSEQAREHDKRNH